MRRGVASVVACVGGVVGLAAPGSVSRAAASDVPRAGEQAWRELVGVDLSRVEVQLVALRSDGELVARERDGAGVRRSMNDVLALLPLDAPVPASQASPAGVLQLTDGTSLPGQVQGVAAAPGEDAAVLWATPALGTVRAKLDDIRLLWNERSPMPARVQERLRGASEDVALLANGDVREGFIELSADEGGEPALRVEQGGQTATVALSLVRGLALANPATPSAGRWVWMNDGSVLGVQRVVMPAGMDMELGLALHAGSAGDAQTLSLDAARVRAIVFDRARLRGLEECALTSEPSDPQRRYTPPAVVRGVVSQFGQSAPGTSDVELPGPMRVRAELPTGATLIDGVVELPRDCRTFGSVGIVITHDGRELARVKLDGANPSASFRGVLSGSGVLEFLVDDAGDGAIEDRVLVRRTLIAITP